MVQYATQTCKMPISDLSWATHTDREHRAHFVHTCCICRRAACWATHADREHRAHFVHAVSVGELRDVAQLGARGQLVADLVHQEAGELFHAARCATHTHVLPTQDAALSNKQHTATHIHIHTQTSGRNGTCVNWLQCYPDTLVGQRLQPASSIHIINHSACFPFSNLSMTFIRKREWL